MSFLTVAHSMRFGESAYKIMVLFSNLKSLILSSLDRNPVSFTRSAILDPGCPTLADICKSSEKELKDFVRDGFYVQSKPSDMGDACIWQGVYTAMCVYRWRALKTKESRELMLDASEALSKYVLTGVLYRGAMLTSLLGDLYQKDPSKEYFDSNGYTYRDDASLDSLLGFCFGAATIMRSGDFDAKASIRAAVRLLASQFAEDEFRLIKRDGYPTKYGDCKPGFFQAPVRTMAACLPSLIAGTDDWRKIASEYAPEFETTDTQFPFRPVSWVNAHLAILANLTYVMATMESDPGHFEARAGLNRLLDKYSDAGNAFLIFGCVAAGIPVSGDDRRIGELVLSEFPLKEKSMSPVCPVNAQPTPVHLRPRFDVVWQRSPYEQGGGEGDERSLNRMDFLLPYYMKMGANVH